MKHLVLFPLCLIELRSTGKLIWLLTNLVSYSYSHPALISTPPTTWKGEFCMQQMRNTLVWLRLGTTISENLLLPLVTMLLGSKRSLRRHSRWTARPVTRGQLSLMTQVAVTGDPQGTTELDAWTLAHDCVSSSNSEKINENVAHWRKYWF